jgi:NitT/TauT family transport system substrate-binding protein
MRASWCAALVASVAWLAPMSGRAEEALPKVAVGFIAAGDFIPLFVAAEKGQFRAHGVDVVPTPVQYANTVPAALVSGSIQIGMTTLPIFAQAREGGLDLVAIAGMTRDNRSNPQLSLLVRPGSPIHAARDLEGRKVAVPGVNSLFDTVLMHWIGQEGGDYKKVTFLEVPMPQLTDVLRGGSVDAIAVIDPFRAKAIADGTAVKLSDFLVATRDDQPLAFWIAPRAWAEQNHAAVTAFRAGLADGLASVTANPGEAREIGAKYLRGQKPAAFPNWSLAMTPDDLLFEAGLETELGVLREKFDAQAAVFK